MKSLSLKKKSKNLHLKKWSPSLKLLHLLKKSKTNKSNKSKSRAI